MTLLGTLRLPALVSAGALFIACSTVKTTPSAAPNDPDPTDDANDATGQNQNPVTESDAGTDAAPPGPPFKPSFPTVNTLGGPVMKAGKVIPIIFSGDPMAASIKDFTKKLGQSEYWANVGKEYGVGPYTAGDAITPSDAAPTSTTQKGIEDWLKGKLNGVNPEFGKPDSNTLYAIYYPQGTTIEDDGSGLGTSCQSYGGYHADIVVGNNQDVGYAVLPRCADLDYLTIAASHETFEWATDPFPMTTPAYTALDDAHWAWQIVMLGELSDMCTYMDHSFVQPPELGFTVQRHWSNTFSLAGAFPCAPVKDVPYFQAIAETNAKAVVPDRFGKGSLTTDAIKVEVNKKTTVDVHIYSDKPVDGEIDLRVMGYEEYSGQQSTTGFDFSLQQTSATVGSTVQLDLTTSQKGFDIALIVARVNQMGMHTWPVLVTTETTTPKTTKLGEGTDLAEMFQRLAAQAAAKRPRATVAGLPTERLTGKFGFGNVTAPVRAR
jgi:hypothetical protein